MLFSIPNLRSSAVSLSEPWKHTGTRPLFKSKEEFRKWCSDPNTNWVFFSTFEGTNANVRVSRQNPALKIHGVVADYDVTVSLQEIVSLIDKNAPVKPKYFSQTFSGGARLVWLFEEASFIDNAKLASNLLKVAAKELKLKSIIGGFDPSSLETTQYFEIGENWMEIQEADPISATTVGFWMHEACKKVSLAAEGPEIPIELAREEMEKQFPGRWTTAFEIGSRGPLFWINDGISRVGCEVAPTGMICYSSRAGTNFAPWDVVFGKSFVKEFEAKKYGTIIDQFFYDGTTYWWKKDGGEWRSANKEDTILYLKVAHKLNCRTKEHDTSSEIEQVLYTIQNSKSIDAALPFLFNKNLIVDNNGARHLNINRRHVMQPIEDEHRLAWGENFPWIAEFLDKSFDPEEQKQYLLEWLRRFYFPALNGNLQPGHTLFIAGPHGRGKSFFGIQILRQIMGGGTDASSFLMSETSFNKEMLEVSVWNVDDGTSSADWKSHRRFSEMVKKSAANQFFNYHPKFKDAQTMPWRGRVVVTLNDDPQSLNLIPATDGTIMDKIMLLKMSPKFEPLFSSNQDENNAMITRELPYFLRWLIQNPAHPCIKKSPRFGFEPYHHPSLVQASLDQNPSFRFIETLDVFRAEYKRHHADKTTFEGTVTELLREINKVDGLKEINREHAGVVGRWLHQLHAHVDWMHAPRTKDGRTLWKVILP
jgi:hypothetical protein